MKKLLLLISVLYSFSFAEEVKDLNIINFEAKDLISVFDIEKDCTKKNDLYLCNKNDYIHKDFKIGKITAELKEEKDVFIFNTLELEKFTYLKNDFIEGLTVDKINVLEDNNVTTFVLNNVKQIKNNINYEKINFKIDDKNEFDKVLYLEIFNKNISLLNISSSIKLVYDDKNNVYDFIIKDFNFKHNNFILGDKEKEDFEHISFYNMLKAYYKIDFFQKVKDKEYKIDIEATNLKDTTFKQYVAIYLFNVLSPQEANEKGLNLKDFLFSTINIIEKK